MHNYLFRMTFEFYFVGRRIVIYVEKTESGPSFCKTRVSIEIREIVQFIPEVVGYRLGKLKSFF